MNEARRLAYLRAMGIDCYVLRESGSADTPPLASEAVEQQPDATAIIPEPAGSETVSREVNKKVSREEAENGLQETVSAQPLPEPVALVRPATTPDPAEDRPDPGDEQLRFSLQFYPLTDKIAAINELPYLGNERTQTAVARLLQAIMKALGITLAETVNPDRFNWPLAVDDDPSASRSPEAMQALQGFLSRRLEGADYRVVVVFANQFEALFVNGGIEQQIASSGARVIYTHSLDAMLKVPALKKVVWQDVRGIPALLGS